MSTCKSCGARIVWLRTPRGSTMPVDDVPEEVLVTSLGAVVRGRRPHWSTCPTANLHRDQGEQLTLEDRGGR